MQVVHTIVPSICFGKIVKIVDSATVDVNLSTTPVGGIIGNTRMQFLQDNKYRVGDAVAALCGFLFDATRGRYVDIDTAYKMMVIGHRTGSVLDGDDFKDGNALTKDRYDEDNVSYTNRRNGAGTIVYDSGKVRTATSDVVFSDMIPGGMKSYQNYKFDHAQNYHKVVACDAPLIATREHFGFDGSNFVYRRFVSTDLKMTKYTAVCEGAFAPFVGGNGDSDTLPKPARDTIYYRTVQSGLNRVTIDIGKDYVIRTDKVITDEMCPGGFATPAVVGNISMISMGADGSFSIKADAAGTPGVALHKMVIDYDPTNGLSVMCGGKITLAHGTGSESINSIVIDPNAGVDVTAMNGFRVNGKAVVTEDFLAWLDTNKTNLCMVTQIGGPAPIFPSALATLAIGAESPQIAGGFTTMNAGAPAIGINTTPDVYATA